MNANLSELESQITTLRRKVEDTRSKPHKLVMLLAVLDLADSGLLQANRIFYGQELISRFEKYFEAVAEEKDWCQPSLPFFHLRSADFWFHKVKPGREEEYAKLTTSGGGSKRILENIEYSYLSANAFEVISDDTLRGELRKFIITLFPPTLSERINKERMS